MPVRMMPDSGGEWPAHLDPIKTAFPPEPTRRAWRESRAFDAALPPLPWRTRRRLYLEARHNPDDSRRTEWRASGCPPRS
jgi:hypothetical protein